MSSCRLFLALAVTLTWCAAFSAGNPPDDLDTRLKKDLAVQSAMHRARLYLIENQPLKAVELLEEQLRNVNGNGAYLVLLRDAYRNHVRDLYLAGQPEQAKRYLDRLCILDPAAANEFASKPQAAAPAKKAEVKANEVSIFPKFNPGTFKMPNLNLFAKNEEPKPPVVQASTARGVSDQSIVDDDPFDGKNQRAGIADAGKATAQEFLMRGADDFRNERYADARICFERAYQAEANSLEACKEQWAYCILRYVSETMEQPGVLPGRQAELQQQVDAAIRMAPTKMLASGQQLLEQMERRGKSAGAAPAAPAVAMASSRVRHWGQNREGWQVVETAHFRIFHRQDSDFGERVAQIAETTRAAMFKKWFDSNGIEWEPSCELVMHANAASYGKMTGTPGTAAGHSSIVIDSGRILSRRMDMHVDAPDLLEAVLPHETTHVVLAGMLGDKLPPRWADEGIAILTEPAGKVTQHHRNLRRFHQDGRLFGLKELMELKDYPAPHSLPIFYAQSVALCEFLAAEKNPKTLTDFVRDGVRHGYETSLRRHYNMTFSQLEERWTQQVLNRPATK